MGFNRKDIHKDGAPATKTVDITFGGTKATALCFSQSITAVTGTYRSNQSTKASGTEFGLYDETKLMKDVE